MSGPFIFIATNRLRDCMFGAAQQGYQSWPGSSRRVSRG